MPSSGRAAYGPSAQHPAAAFAASDPVIVFDSSGAAEALRDCVWRKFAGQQVLVRPILQRDSAARADAVAASIMQSFSDPDQRRLATAQAVEGTLNVNGRLIRELPAYDASGLRLMQAVVRLSDGIAISGEAERRRIQDILETDPPAFSRILRDPSVPMPEGDDLGHPRDAVVIWAPELSGDVAFSFALPLSDLHAALVLVAATPPSNGAAALWVSPSRSRDGLRRAKLIVTANAYGSDTAVALARWNAPLVVDAESGAQEHVSHARSFDRRRFKSIFDAAVTALGDPPAVVRSDKQAPTYSAETADAVSGPLVSILLPTYNRPALLRYALESCRRQTYRNVETIVAVGGGARFDELAAAYPEVRFLHLDENIPAASLNAAFAAANGEYITILNDDDLFFPHHVASLVSALERSGGAVAHGDVLTAYLRGDDDERLSLYGFESNMSRTVDPSSMMIANRIGATSAMVRRSCLSECLYDMAIPYYRDYALWLSLAVKHDFIHVERITSCYTIRNQGRAQQSTTDHDKAVAAYRAIYARHPVQGRPSIEQQRAQMLESVRMGSTSLIPEPAMQLAPVQWPPF